MARRPIHAAFDQGEIPTIACFNKATSDPGVDFDKLITVMQAYVDRHVAHGPKRGPTFDRGFARVNGINVIPGPGMGANGLVPELRAIVGGAHDRVRARAEKVLDDLANGTRDRAQSSALQRYQLATVRYGRQRSPRRAIVSGFGSSRLRKASLNPLRTP